ncbi:hypothetical protein [Psychrobacillus phage Perkons]|nr:hypothetical protein [Psychrobacillus phage Perkons]
MSKITLDNATITESTIGDHINYTKREIVGYDPTYCNAWDERGNCIGTGGGDPIYGNVPYKTSAKINGTITATVTNVKINGKSPIVVGDKTNESDSYTIPTGGTYTSGSHTGVTTGSVTVGNAKNVYVNGKSVAIGGSTVTTHAGTSATIRDGLSSSVNIGG